jgi:RNA polymerase sigma factor (sigma-70 family)
MCFVIIIIIFGFSKQNESCIIATSKNNYNSNLCKMKLLKRTLARFNLNFKRILIFNKEKNIEENGEHHLKNDSTLATINNMTDKAPELKKEAIQELIQRDQLFISYCHKDKIWLDKLSPYLSTIENFNGIKTWNDKIIMPGDTWNKEITKALHSAKVAVFLVSQNFLASKFIKEKEMDYFLEINKNQTIPIFWIAISSCLFDCTSLKSIQCANDPHTPLDILSEAEQNKEITKICKKLQKLLTETNLGDDETPSIEVAIPSEVKQNTFVNSIKKNPTSINKKIKIQITIDSDFDSYSETEVKIFLDNLKSLLSITGDIRIISKERGSVLLTIELDYKDAEKVYTAINEGRLKDLQAISAKVKVTPQPSISYQIVNYDNQIKIYGNQKTFKESMHRYWDIVYNMLFGLVNNKRDAEQLAIQTFLDAFTQQEKHVTDVKKYEAGKPTKSWLLEIATNNYHDFIENKKNDPYSIYPNIEDDMEPELKGIAKVMNQLPPDYYQLIQMRYFDNFPIEEIAKSLGLSFDVVKSRLGRARKLLAVLLEESDSNLKESDINFWDSDKKF